MGGEGAAAAEGGGCLRYRGPMWPRCSVQGESMRYILHAKLRPSIISRARVDAMPAWWGEWFGFGATIDAALAAAATCAAAVAAEEGAPAPAPAPASASLILRAACAPPALLALAALAALVAAWLLWARAQEAPCEAPPTRAPSTATLSRLFADRGSPTSAGGGGEHGSAVTAVRFTADAPERLSQAPPGPAEGDEGVVAAAERAERPEEPLVLALPLGQAMVRLNHRPPWLRASLTASRERLVVCVVDESDAGLTVASGAAGGRTVLEVELASVVSLRLFSQKLFPGSKASTVAGARLEIEAPGGRKVVEIGFVGARVRPMRAFRLLRDAHRRARRERQRAGRPRGRRRLAVGQAVGSAACDAAATAVVAGGLIAGVEGTVTAVERMLPSTFEQGKGAPEAPAATAGEAAPGRRMSVADAAVRELTARLRGGRVIALQDSELREVHAEDGVLVECADGKQALSAFFAAAFAGPALTEYSQHFREFDLRWGRWTREDAGEAAVGGSGMADRSSAAADEEPSPDGNVALNAAQASELLGSGARRMVSLRAIKRVVGEKPTRVTKIQRAYRDGARAMVYEEGSMAHDVPCGNRFIVSTRWRVEAAEPSGGNGSGAGATALAIRAATGVEFLKGCNMLTGAIRGGAIKEMRGCVAKHLEIAKAHLPRAPAAVSAGGAIG